ncbi:mannose-1-phosphate guanylyltransferase [Paenibacillus agilis]|uniref:Mannose-1-phosphate guanylyltransferase n=1 Tax=Paenibacillus agilis TaxID=3020863 RepID=A0A559IWU8_9BACL|nr:sugar phosphate nucleotidyltransferase [Paenibacillus agilis]TVX92110.1 mannose-1-phosphate guanylyltransferase [Paenibacillus agilis]
MNIVIMAGGKGIRFWPKSTEHKPKQFLPLLSSRTLLQETYARYRQWLPASRIYVATTHAYSELVMEQLPECEPGQLIIEPCARDTAPCIALTALSFLHRNQDEPLAIVPSDQHVPHVNKLRDALYIATKEAAHHHYVVMLGLVPTRPETGFGYIRANEELSNNGLLPVSSFIEKPNLSTAQQLIHTPRTYWNSGIFVWRPSTIAHLMEKHCPSIWKPLAEAYPSTNEIYPLLPKLSVDYAIMEHASQLYVLPVDMEWDDVGTWNAVKRYYDEDEAGNVAQGNIRSLDAHNNIIFSDKEAVVIGASNLIIISTEDGLLVCHQSEEQRIKEVMKDKAVWKQHFIKEVKSSP